VAATNSYMHYNHTFSTSRLTLTAEGGVDITSVSISY